MGAPRVRNNLATEQQQQFLIIDPDIFYLLTDKCRTGTYPGLKQNISGCTQHTSIHILVTVSTNVSFLVSTDPTCWEPTDDSLIKHFTLWQGTDYQFLLLEWGSPSWIWLSWQPVLRSLQVSYTFWALFLILNRSLGRIFRSQVTEARLYLQM